jgi:integrase
VKDNLKSWLLPHRKNTGKVCPFENTTKQLLKLAAKAKIKWKKNALRHSCISYRIAECGDVPRVSDESGNSVKVIRTNYLRRVKPAVAAEWFGIMPPRAKAKGRKLAL